MKADTYFKNNTFTINEEFRELVKQISISMTDQLEDGIIKCAKNTTKKYMVYWYTSFCGTLVADFELFDSNEKLREGYLIDLDKVREYLRTHEDIV